MRRLSLVLACASAALCTCGVVLTYLNASYGHPLAAAACAGFSVANALAGCLSLATALRRPV